MLVLSCRDVAILGCTSREPAGGGRGRKLDSERGDKSTDGRVEDERVRADDVARRGARVCS